MARISELHYSNTYASQSGVAEFLEVALTPGEAASESNYVVTFYHTNGQVMLELDLSDPLFTSATDPNSGEVVYTLSSADTGIFLTDPDGNITNNASAFALTDVSTGPNTVINFYDIGGGTSDIEAMGGAALGAISDNIDLADVSPNLIGGSIQWNQPDPDNFVVDAVSQGDTGAICFTTGTLIETHEGPKKVERLMVGDKVLTKDSKYQPINWISHRTVKAQKNLAPIVISENALGEHAELVVSPEHRILIRDWRAQLLFAEEEVLVAAKNLVNGSSIYRRSGGNVTYYHFSFDDHQIVYANGLEAESFLPTIYSLSCLSTEARAEFFTIFPEFAVSEKPQWQCCLRSLTGQEARLIS